MEFSSSKMNHGPKSNEKEENSSNPKTLNEYKEKISTLPRRQGWMSDQVHQYQGFWHTFLYLEGLLSAQEHFKPQPNDIILSSTPKSGTTWLKALSFDIVTRSSFNASTNPLLTTMPHECVPSMEGDLAQNSFHRNLDTPLIEIPRMYLYLYGTFFARRVLRVWIPRVEKKLTLKRHLSYFVMEYLIMDHIGIMY
uniref:Sulfotransferase n=1 Tax=Fagus sylvatica TaxID=28930 RepID=A0A2N9J6L4_FAGSY